jgi:TonB-linked SusC/RagA family outer membrane protein
MRRRLKSCAIAIILLGFAIPSFAQGRVNIQGQVVDETTGDPIIGASITVSSEKSGAVADVDGAFTLRVKGLPVTLAVKYLGYKTVEVDVYEYTEPLTIQLKENISFLDEVVVTALGITKEKKSLGYATQNVKGDELNGNTSTNIVNALAGKAAGVRITNGSGEIGGSRIIIRGETSITGNNQPLFVVDGVPVDNSQYNAGDQYRDFRNAVADLNPDDIESLNILKGPNAAALYGYRAAHGVILITTKKGTAKQGLGINVTAGVSFANIVNLAKYQNEFGQGTEGEFSFVDGKGSGINDGYDESWGPRLDGRLIPQFDSPIVNGVRQATPWVAHPNNVNDFFETGVTQDYGISIANGDDKYSYRLGAHYQDQKGTAPNTQIKKTNLSYSGDYALTKRIKVGANINYIVTDAPNIPGTSNGSGSSLRGNNIMLQFLWFGRQVDTKSLKEGQTVNRNWNANYYDNPYWQQFYNTTEQNRNRIIGDVHFSVNILEGLDFRFRTGTDYYNDKRKSKFRTGSSGAGRPDGSYSEDAYTVNENNTEAILNYAHKFSDDWSLDALAGFNVRNYKFENNFQNASKLAAPDLYTVSNSKDPLVSTNQLKRLRVYSDFASAQIAYRSWAYLNLTGRNDWSSTLAKNNRSYFYPSATASVILSDALDIKSEVLSFLKVRGGWASVGSGGEEPYQLVTTYNIGSPFNGNPIQTSSTTKNNPELKPERTNSTELGVEVGFLDNRILLDLGVYNSNSIDQIIPVQTSAASGYTNQVINGGTLNNKGIEIQLRTTPVKTKKFSWNLDLNYATNRSKVVELDKEGLLQNLVLGTAGPQIVAAVGERYGAIFGTAWKRNASGDILVGDNGRPLKDPTNKILGYFTPDWTGGITNTFTYKNISLSALIDASVGGSIYSSSASTGVMAGVYESSLFGRSAEFGGLTWTDGNGKVRDDGVIFQGINENTGQPNNVIISAETYHGQSAHEKYVYDASYVKLRDISLTYNFKKSLIQKWGVGGLSISAVAHNVAILYRDKDLDADPETALNTGNVQGVTGLARPSTRSFGFNINLKF